MVCCKVGNGGRGLGVLASREVPVEQLINALKSILSSRNRSTFLDQCGIGGMGDNVGIDGFRVIDGGEWSIVGIGQSNQP